MTRRKRFRLKQLGLLPWVAGGVLALGIVAVIAALFMGGSSRGKIASTASPSEGSPPATVSGADQRRAAHSEDDNPFGSRPSGAPTPPSFPTGQFAGPGTGNPFPSPLGPPVLPADTPLPSPSAPLGRGGRFWITSTTTTPSSVGNTAAVRVIFRYDFTGEPGGAYNAVVEHRDGTRKTLRFAANAKSADFATTFAGWGLQDLPLKVHVEDSNGTPVSNMVEAIGPPKTSKPVIAGPAAAPSGDTGLGAASAGRQFRFKKCNTGWGGSGDWATTRVTIDYDFTGIVGQSFNLIVAGKDGTRKIAPFAPTSSSGSFTATFEKWGVGVDDVWVEDLSGTQVSTAGLKPGARYHPIAESRVEPSKGAAPGADSAMPDAARLPPDQGIPGAAPARGHPTDLIGDRFGLPFNQIGDGSPVIGFTYSAGEFGRKPAIRKLTPIYDRDSQDPSQVVAKEGYAVGALEARFAPWVSGVRVVFMRLGDDGRLDTKDKYKSPWIGQSAGALQTVTSDGRKVIGIRDRRAGLLRAVGLVLE